MAVQDLGMAQMHLVALLALCLLGALAGAPGAAAGEAAAGRLVVYVGARTKGKGTGIHRYHLDLATGAMTHVGVTSRVTNPWFLAVHPGHRFLYAVSEMGRFKGKRTGAVSAFAIEAKTGELTPLNQQPSGGPGPCHLVVDNAGKNVLVANYSGGSVCVLPIGADGRLGKATAFVQHEGRSVDPRRQTAPHAHSINVDPANRFAFAADLGLDKVMVYRFDAAKGTLAPNEPPFAAVAPGAGPRHFAFHPSGRHAYVINEMNSTITAFAYDATRGVLTSIQTVGTLPKGFEGTSWTAEIRVHPSGKFLYGSNRGHDSIAIFAVDAESGKLAAVGHESTRGKTPRGFNLDPNGTWLVVGNQDTDNVVAFRIDARSGRLRPTGQSVTVGAPVCIEFMRP